MIIDDGANRVSSSADLRESGCLGPEGLRLLRSFDSLGWTTKGRIVDSRLLPLSTNWRFSSLGDCFSSVLSGPCALGWLPSKLDIPPWQHPINGGVILEYRSVNICFKKNLLYICKQKNSQDYCWVRSLNSKDCQQTIIGFSGFFRRSHPSQSAGPEVEKNIPPNLTDGTDRTFFCKPHLVLLCFFAATCICTTCFFWKICTTCICTTWYLSCTLQSLPVQKHPVF